MIFCDRDETFKNDTTCHSSRLSSAMALLPWKEINHVLDTYRLCKFDGFCRNVGSNLRVVYFAEDRTGRRNWGDRHSECYAVIQSLDEGLSGQPEFAVCA